MPEASADLFCRVIDNFGDIGVCWRLARQLHAEHGYQVRLWVDDLQAFARLCPAIDPALPQQALAGLDVRHWTTDSPDPSVRPAALVVEGFACHLPAAWLEAMAARQPAPLWVNLDYLSAEDWVDGCHGLWSPHPRLPLRQLFFFPGFRPTTGGLLREQGLSETRTSFAGDPEQQDAVWATLGLTRPAPATLTVSLFSYENAALPSLLRVWQTTPTLLLVPAGRALEQLARELATPLEPGTRQDLGALRIAALPFLPHEVYDRLLWLCDVNIVRGEDSLVRALWAGQPLLWHIYRQDEQAHLPKLQAFLDGYLEDADAALATAIADLWHAFNREQNATEPWRALQGLLPQWRAHARTFTQKLELQQDLASRLVKFHQEQVQSRVS